MMMFEFPPLSCSLRSNTTIRFPLISLTITSNAKLIVFVQSTFRRDSDIVAPYEKWQYYDNRVQQIEQDHNYAANKTKKVAWFVSNCGARNGRLQFAHELAKYIEVYRIVLSK